jgi:GTP-binding protein
MGCNTKALLARTSSTPGFTKTMNLYGIAPDPGVRIKTSSLTHSGDQGRETIVGRGGLVIVDMPGYGAGSLSAWGVEIMKYIQSRKPLRRVFVLLDAEHGVKDKDRSILASLRLAGVSHQVILSKMDKLYIPKASEIRKVGKGTKLKSKGTVAGLRGKMRELLPDIKPPVGGGALGEILACSSEVLVEGKRLGIEDVRYAVLKAVGLEGEERKGFTESKKKKKVAREAEA